MCEQGWACSVVFRQPSSERIPRGLDPSRID